MKQINNKSLNNSQKFKKTKTQINFITKTNSRRTETNKWKNKQQQHHNIQHHYQINSVTLNSKLGFRNFINLINIHRQISPLITLHVIMN